MGSLVQRVLAVDNGRDLAGFDQLLQKDQVLLANLCDEHEQPLPHEPGQHEYVQRFDEWPEQSLKPEHLERAVPVVGDCPYAGTSSSCFAAGSGCSPGAGSLTRSTTLPVFWPVST